MIYEIITIIAILSVGATGFPQVGLLRSAHINAKVSSDCVRHSKNILILGLDKNNNDVVAKRQEKKDELLAVLSSITRNAPTSPKKSKEILSLVRELEGICPTSEECVLQELNGNWELIWTVQDNSGTEGKQAPWKTWINPLENQAYSNNPQGNANPVLPVQIQDKLESLRIISRETPLLQSSQSISIRQSTVRNLVTFQTPFGVASLTVIISFSPNQQDLRRIDVKFESCRVQIKDSLINFVLPLGPLGPSGWLRTTYIDDIRVTRGFKGSVFVLKRFPKK